MTAERIAEYAVLFGWRNDDGLCWHNGEIMIQRDGPVKAEAMLDALAWAKEHRIGMVIVPGSHLKTWLIDNPFMTISESQTCGDITDLPAAVVEAVWQAGKDMK